MIDAYLDESGIHAGAAVCVIAGYFGGRGQFRKFERAWKVLLRRLGIEMEDFHAKDLVESKDERLLETLAQEIARFKISPISYGVIVDDFYSFSVNQRRFLTGATLNNRGHLIASGSPNKPYFLPFQHLIRRVASYAPVGGKARFFFGLDRTFAGYAKEVFKEIMKNPEHAYRERLSEPQFPLAKVTAQLQAADLLVHLTYDHMLKQMRTNNSYLRRARPLRMLLSNLRVAEDQVYYDKECIRGNLNLIPIDQRGELLTEL